jgi:hypothetical protein
MQTFENMHQYLEMHLLPVNSTVVMFTPGSVCYNVGCGVLDPL